MHIGYKYPSRFWDEHKTEIINMYLNEHKTMNAIGNIYGCYGSTVRNHLKQWGVALRNTASDRYNGNYSVNIHYFDNIDDEHKAYWLGYILADGHVSKTQQVMFGCQLNDIDILKNIQNDLYCTYPIRLNKDGNPTLTICSKYIGKTLLDMGFTHNKSYEVNFQKIISYIPEDLMHHFVRGMFDGDGSIRYYDYSYTKGYQYHFGYTGLKEICQFVADFLHIKTKIIQEKETNTYTLSTSNAPLIRHLYNVLYKDATIYCKRKHIVFRNVLTLISEEKKDEVKGVSFYPKLNKWMSSCHINKVYKTIGYYETKFEAEKARLQYEYDILGYDAPQWFFFDEYNVHTDIKEEQ